jgi:hypothetical protein
MTAKLDTTLKSYISAAAAELAVEPFDLAYNELQKWMKERGDSWLFDNATSIRLKGGYTNLRDTYFQRPMTRASLPVDAVKVRETAARNRKEVKLASREQAFLDKFEEMSARLFEKVVVPAPVSKGSKVKPKTVARELNILLSDLHFGSDLDPRYVPMKYGIVEEARRLAHVVKTVCDYKRDHRAETRLRVHLAGDIIQGQLHDQRDGDILAAQCARAIHLLTQAVAVFAAEFPAGVEIDCSTGNHDRFTSRHKERATYEKADSLATVIYFAVKTATKNLPNVKFEITRKPFTSYESFGAKCFGTHGDTVLNPGYPGNVINAKNLEMQINRINASLPNAEEYKLFFLGHVHVGTVIHMGNGAILITNGALIPSDQYSVSIGLFENSCGQSMWESVKGHVVGDYRFITVNGATDKDESLDKLIVPFVDF